MAQSEVAGAALVTLSPAAAVDAAVGAVPARAALFVSEAFSVVAVVVV